MKFTTSETVVTSETTFTNKNDKILCIVTIFGNFQGGVAQPALVPHLLNESLQLALRFDVHIQLKLLLWAVPNLVIKFMVSDVHYGV